MAKKTIHTMSRQIDQKMKEEQLSKQEKIDKQAAYIARVKKGIEKQQSILEESREFVLDKHKDETELKKITYDPAGRQTAVPSFYDPRDGKLSELEAAHLSLHKCAQESA